jgi:DNA-binding ferritin-like protein
LKKVKRKLKKSNPKRKREASEVAEAEEVVGGAAMVNLVEIVASKEEVEVAEQDLRQPSCMLKNLSSRVRMTNKSTQRQVDLKLKSRSKSRVTSKLPRITTLYCEKLRFSIEV